MNQENIFSTAKWIWNPHAPIPAPGTFVLFRKRIHCAKVPAKATGWIHAVTQYRLYINGKRVQDGPAVADSRWPEVDPLDIAAHLREGDNVIAVEVGYFGNGGADNQWFSGGTGALILEVCTGDSRAVLLATDSGWKCEIDKSHPANTRRSYARFLREVYDACAFSEGWCDAGYDDSSWCGAMELSLNPNRPPHEACQRGNGFLCRRSIPLMKEYEVLPKQVVQWGALEWNAEPDYYFNYVCREQPMLRPYAENAPATASFPFVINPDKHSSALATFDFGAEITGYPVLEIEAAENTIIDLIFSEKPLPPGPLWLDRFRNTVRVICRNGRTVFHAFDYEAVKLVQVVIRNATGPVSLHRLSAIRRVYDFPHQPEFESSDEDVNRVFRAAVNTELNNCQDYCMDNVFRERGPYGPMAGTALSAFFGGDKLFERAMRLIAQSQCEEGWIFEGWPGYVRIGELPGVYMNLGATHCLIDGPLCQLISLYNQHLLSGHTEFLMEIYPVIATYMRWLLDHRRPDGLLPEKPNMWHRTWIDHMGGPGGLPTLNMFFYQCCRTSVPGIEAVLGVSDLTAILKTAADEIAGTLKKNYWEDDLKLYIVNLPRFKAGDDKQPHTHELTLSMALLFGLIPAKDSGNALRALIEYPHPMEQTWFPITFGNSRHGRTITMGIAHPTNGGLRLNALASLGRGDVVVRDLIRRWGNMLSIEENNTLSEGWEGKNGGPNCYGAPIDVRCQTDNAALEAFHRCILGVYPLTPGWATFALKPQLGALDWARGTVWTPQGPIKISARKSDNDRVVCELEHPRDCTPIMAENVTLKI